MSAHLEEDLEFSCPYCMSVNSVRIDATGGLDQNFITDCETCCSPIVIEVQIEEDGYINLTAKRDGEG
jgi:hypothetical protein